MKRKTLNGNGRLISIDRPAVMGIVNVTPDSFYDGGKYPTVADLLKRCETMLAEGAAIIDVGAVSTRPAADDVDAEEEMKRLEKALLPIRKHFPDAIISVDTYRADVAKKAVQNYEIDMINDISGGAFDVNMFETVASLNVGYILTHIQETRTDNSLMPDIIEYFSEKVHRLHSLGVKDVIIDPGFGFGKTLAQNYEILKNLKKLEIFDLPIMIGVSRKSMIYRLLETDAAHALNGTTAVHTIALLGGADILRVHDVKEAVECINLVSYIKNIS